MHGADTDAGDPLADPSRPVPNLACADRFEAFYRAQGLVATESEWRHFISTLHRALPVTIRVQSATEALGAECRRSLAELLADAGSSLPDVVELPWCSSWSIGVSKEVLKASREPAHTATQAWLTKWAALGALTRQAIESMVPVALLGADWLGCREADHGGER